MKVLIYKLGSGYAFEVKHPETGMPIFSSLKLYSTVSAAKEDVAASVRAIRAIATPAVEFDWEVDR